MGSHATDLALDIAVSFASGISARLVSGPEEYQYQQAAKKAIDLLKADYNLDKVRVISWNRLSGFATGAADTLPPKDKTNVPEYAWNFMIKSTFDIKKAQKDANLPDAKLLFDPAEDIIFLIRDFDGIMDAQSWNGTLVTMLRTYINGAMGTSIEDEGNDRTKDRGRRMLVFLSVNKDVGKFLPELSPLTVSLPGPEASRQAINLAFEGLVAANKEDVTKGLAEPTEPEYEALVNALTGMPFQDREDAISKAVQRNRDGIRKHRKLGPILPEFCATIEDEKARFIEGIAGLTYVPKNSLPTNSLPGYEAVNEWVDTAIHIDVAKARAHGLPPARGILMIGAQGVGKTEFARTISRRANRILLQMSPGEIQGGIVGQSEAQMRRALDIIQQMKPVVFVDEIDKAGMASIQGGHQGDGGSFSRMIGMLLAAMTDPSNEAIWVMAANRLVSVDGQILLPAPLIRAGRIDERYWIELPDETIRGMILRVHMKKHNIEADNDGAIDDIAHSTEQWVGAELADLIVRGTRRAIHTGKSKLDTQWMRSHVAHSTPLASTEAFMAELEANRRACSKFTKVGQSTKIGMAARLGVDNGPDRSGRKATV